MMNVTLLLENLKNQDIYVAHSLLLFVENERVKN